MSMSPDRVLDRVRNTQGELIGQTLLNRVVGEGVDADDIADGLIVFGLPRSGKSTFLGDIIAAAKKKGIIVDLLQQEDTLDRTEVLLGQQPLKRQIMREVGIEGEIFPRRLWDEDDYLFYSDNFLEDILEQEQRCGLIRVKGKRVLRVVEAFAVNPEDGFDRGLSALIRYADILRERAQFKTLFEGVAQDPGALIKGNLVQAAASDIEDLTQIKRVLARRPTNLRVKGIGNSWEDGELIQKTILAWASPKRAEDASDQVYGAALQWAHKNEDKIAAVVLPDISRYVLNSHQQYRYRVNAAYMQEDILNRRISVPTGWGDVLLSPVDPRIKVPWNIRPFIRGRERLASCLILNHIPKASD